MSAGRPGLADRARRAAAVAPELRVAVSARDLLTGEHHAAGDPGEFGAASVLKVLVAARLLIEAGGGDGLDPETARLAHVMITASDDDAADLLWDRTGGPALEPWIEERYRLPGLGSPNTIPGRWGNTHVTAAGLTALYGALVADDLVWPWLGPALAAITPVASDGTDQRFGLLAVDPAAAVKQGWAGGSSDDPANAVVHTTGITDGGRLAVAVLTEGHGNRAGCDSRGLHAEQAARLTDVVRVLLDWTAAPRPQPRHARYDRGRTPVNVIDSTPR